MNFQAHVYLVIHITNMPNHKGDIDMDPDTLKEILENALKQPFDDGIVDTLLPCPARATIEISTINYGDPDKKAKY